jgi:hypothetical protein
MTAPANIYLDPEEILGKFGGGDKNDLIKILNLEPEEYANNDCVFMTKQSNYYDINGMKQFLEINKGSFNILSLNSRSILNKFNKITILLNSLHEMELSFDVICIQECWLAPNADVNALHINHYKLFHQGYNPDCSTRGGLVCYVNEDLSSKVIRKCNKYSM